MISCARALCIAGLFFTRFPFRVKGKIEPEDLKKSGWVFPIIGALIGLIGGTVFLLCSEIGFSPGVCAILAVLSLILATGGLHEDGLADTFDGCFGGYDKTTRLNIMRDSQVGAFGIIALIFSIYLRCIVFIDLSELGLVFIGFIVSGAISRGILPLSTIFLDPARVNGMASKMGKFSPDLSLLSAGLSVVIMMLLIDVLVVIFICVVVLFAVGIFMIIVKRLLGGYTGDTLGAYQQIAEIVTLLAIGVCA